MARERKRPESDPPALSMTPMIDVVFQLLIYFVVTLKPPVVVTNLDVFQPQGQAPNSDNEPKLYRVEVFSDGYRLNDVFMPLDKIDDRLHKLAQANPNMTLMIVIASDSPHGNLVDLLDRCAKNGITSLSVISSPT